jgi:hypothetical protein
VTTPLGFNRRSLAFYSSARGSVANRESTADFVAALRAHATALGLDELGLNLQDINQLRSAAVRQRTAQERFQASSDANAIDNTMIGAPPFGRSLEAQAAQPIYEVGINLHVANDEGEVTTQYTQVRFTGDMTMSKADLLAAVQYDAEALAQGYGGNYAGHDVIEITAR